MFANGCGGVSILCFHACPWTPGDPLRDPLQRPLPETPQRPMGHGSKSVSKELNTCKTHKNSKKVSITLRRIIPVRCMKSCGFSKVETFLFIPFIFALHTITIGAQENNKSSKHFDCFTPMTQNPQK